MTFICLSVLNSNFAPPFSEVIRTNFNGIVLNSMVSHAMFKCLPVLDGLVEEQ